MTPAERTARGRSAKWQVLRRDVPTFLASGAVYLASVSVVVALLGLFSAGSSSLFSQSLFWSLAVPLTFWALALGNYGPRAVTILLVLLIADTPLAAAILAAAIYSGVQPLALFVLSTAITCCLILGGAIAYRRSALARLGPFRLDKAKG